MSRRQILLVLIIFLPYCFHKPQCPRPVTPPIGHVSLGAICMFWVPVPHNRVHRIEILDLQELFLMIQIACLSIYPDAPEVEFLQVWECGYDGNHVLGRHSHTDTQHFERLPARRGQHVDDPPDLVAAHGRDMQPLQATESPNLARIVHVWACVIELESSQMWSACQQLQDCAAVLIRHVDGGVLQVWAILEKLQEIWLRRGRRGQAQLSESERLPQLIDRHLDLALEQLHVVRISFQIQWQKVVVVLERIAVAVVTRVAPPAVVGIVRVVAISLHND